MPTTTAPTSSHIAEPLLLRPYRKIPKPVCAISNGAWRSHFFQIPRSLSSLTLPALPPITILWESPREQLGSPALAHLHCLPPYTIHQTMLQVLSHP